MTRKLPPAVRARALQIAHHEMGHYVMARTLGFATGSVHLNVTMDLRHQGGASISLAQPITSMQAMQDYLRARVMILMAGAMAQSLTSKHTVDKAKATAILKSGGGAEQDYAKLRELQHLLRNMAYPDTDPTAIQCIAAQLKIITDQAWSRAQAIIEEQAETITELAGMLVDAMALVEQWGRPADTYEGVLTGPVLERLGSASFDKAAL
ncbi:peptidase M41 [Pseudomonas vancouverensis]|uniref:peptidase M41 n=1 Tax=Pseudomonas vancouverensis TaxID=95300 RepID=UPI003CFF823C